jgi:ATP-dependent HslUV protease ATP-binding subunit HslU
LKSSNFSINTKNILFVALGAFTKNKPSDLITEIQGRLPIHCSVEALKPKEFKEILKKSKLSVLNQVVLLMKSEGIEIIFNDDAIDEIAEISFYINQTHEDTGARRLMSVLNIVLNDITFYAPEIYNEYKMEDKEIILTIDREYVKRACEDEMQRIKDHKKYII